VSIWRAFGPSILNKETVMDNKVSSKKIANNILEFLVDPSAFPLERRLYFHPEEILMNESFEKAKRESEQAYGDQRHNSDFLSKPTIT